MYGDGKAFVDMPLKVAPGRPCRPFALYAGDETAKINASKHRRGLRFDANAATKDGRRFPQGVDADRQVDGGNSPMWRSCWSPGRFSGRRINSEALPLRRAGREVREATTGTYWIVKDYYVWDEETALGMVCACGRRAQFRLRAERQPDVLRGPVAASLLAEMVSLLDDDALPEAQH